MKKINSTGTLIKNYTLVGQSSLYKPNNKIAHFGMQESCIFDIDILVQSKLLKPITFYGTYIDKGSKLFRHIVIPLDNKRGIKNYEKNKRVLAEIS